MERMVGTFAASFVGLVTVDQVVSGVYLDWLTIFKAALIITGLTLLKTLAAFSVNGTPGFTEAETLAPVAS